MAITTRSSGALYELLEVPKTATATEIKKAYHKKALVLHPDKTNGTTTDQFKQIQEANAILSDPEKRKMYDKVGRAGLAKLEQYGMDGMAAQAFASAAVQRVVSFAIFIIFFLALLFVSLVCARFDGPKEWEWAAVFTPVWVLCFVVVPVAAFIVFQSVKDRRVENVLTGLSILVGVVAIALFVRTLDGKIDSWDTFFNVVFVMLGLYYSGDIMSLRPSALKERLVAQGHPAGSDHINLTHPFFIQQVISTFFSCLCNIIFVSLMRQRLCLSLPDLSFYAVFSPVFVRYSVPVAVAFVFTMIEAPPTITIRERLCMGLLTFLSVCGTLYTVVMISIKMQRELNNGDKGPSASTCSILLFVVLGIATISSLCAFACIREDLDEGYAEVVPDTSEAAETGDLNVAVPATSSPTDSLTRSPPAPGDTAALTSNYNSLD